MYNDLPGAAADKQTYRLISRYHGNQVFLALEVCTAAQSQKAASAYFTSKQILLLALQSSILVPRYDSVNVY